MNKIIILFSLLFSMGIHSVHAADDDSEPRLKFKKAWKQQFNSMFDSMFEPFDDERFGFQSFQPPKIVPDIKKVKEDDKFIYYDLSLNGSKPEKVDVNVSGNQIEVTGSIQKKNYYSSFHRSFPAPEDVDPNRAEMVNEGKQLLLKLPKKSK